PRSSALSLPARQESPATSELPSALSPPLEIEDVLHPAPEPDVLSRHPCRDRIHHLCQLQPVCLPCRDIGRVSEKDESPAVAVPADRDGYLPVSHVSPSGCRRSGKGPRSGAFLGGGTAERRLCSSSYLLSPQ